MNSADSLMKVPMLSSCPRRIFTSFSWTKCFVRQHTRTANLFLPGARFHFRVVETPVKKKQLAVLLIWATTSLWTIAHGQRPVEDLSKLRKPELIELIQLDPTFKLDIRYATNNNFVGRPVYKEARAFLQRPAAEALVRVNKALARQGFGLVVFDGYRPWYVTKLFWGATPDDRKEFVADPAKGSRHNRGSAVDVSLYDLKSGKEVKMPSGYDEMTERAYPTYKCAPPEVLKMREILRAAMEAEGFTVNESEWWHFDYKDWDKYPIMDVSFSAIERMQ
jgi:D-alanyl-D-alanine dipeptidase